MEGQKKTETKFQFSYVVFFQLIILTSFYSQSQYEEKFGLIASPYIWTFVSSIVIYGVLHYLKKEIKNLVGILVFVGTILIYINLNFFLKTETPVTFNKQMDRKFLQGWWNTTFRGENIFMFFKNDSTYLLSPRSWRTNTFYFEVHGDFLYADGTSKNVKYVNDNQFTMKMDSIYATFTRIDTTKIKIEFF